MEKVLLVTLAFSLLFIASQAASFYSQQRVMPESNQKQEDVAQRIKRDINQYFGQALDAPESELSYIIISFSKKYFTQSAIIILECFQNDN